MKRDTKPTDAELRLREKLDEHLRSRAREYGFSEAAIAHGISGWVKSKRDGTVRTLKVKRGGRRHVFRLPADRADEGFRRAVNTRTRQALVAERQAEERETPECRARTLAELMALADLITERPAEEIDALLELVKQRRAR